MKGIALIRRQIGHLDSVWFLMPDDTVMPLSRCLSLSLSLSHCLTLSLSLSISLSWAPPVCSLSPIVTYYQENRGKIRVNDKKKKKKTRTVLDYYWHSWKWLLVLFITQWRGFYVCVTVCFSLSCKIAVQLESFPLFIKGNKKYLCSYEKLFVFISCWAFFLFQHSSSLSEGKMVEWQWEPITIEMTSRLSQYSMIKAKDLITCYSSKRIHFLDIHYWIP